MKIKAFHGTTEKFNKFDNSLITDDFNELKANYFTTDYNLAKDYAINRADEKEVHKSYVLECEIDLKNELTFDLSQDWNIIQTYAIQEDDLEKYQAAKEEYTGNDTIEFLKLHAKIYRDSENDMFLEDIFNYFKNNEIIAILNNDDIKIIKVYDESFEDDEE